MFKTLSSTVFGKTLVQFGPLDCAAVDTVAFGASKPRMEICTPRRAHLVLMRKASKELRPKELNDDNGDKPPNSERSESPRSRKTCQKLCSKQG